MKKTLILYEGRYGHSKKAGTQGSALLERGDWQEY